MAAPVISTGRSHPDALSHLDRNTRSVCSGEIYTREPRDFSAPWLRHCGRNDSGLVISTALSHLDALS